MSMGWRSAMADLPTGTVTFLFTDIEGSRQATTMAPPSTAVPACARWRMAAGPCSPRPPMTSYATIPCPASAPITASALVAGTIATTLGGRETGGQPLVASLKAYLRTKQLLLVLDNFEHVVAAAPLVGDLLNPQ